MVQDPVTPAQPTSREDAIYRYLTGTEGLSDAQASGILGNWRVESHFDPNAYNPGENAHGEAQWENGRWSGPNGLEAFAKRANSSPFDLDTQLAFFSYEFNGPYAHVKQQILGTNDPAAAAAIFDEQYEGSSGSTRQDRINYARSIYQAITGGKPLTDGGTDTGTGFTQDNKNPPPYNVTADQGFRNVTITGVKYSHVDKPWTHDDGKDVNDADAKHLKSIPTGAVSKMAQWSPDGKGPAAGNPAALWIAGDHSFYNRAFVAFAYCSAVQQYNVSGPPKIPSIPGLGTLTDLIGLVVNALRWLTDLHNWERVGLFALGAIILVFAADKMFTN